MMMPSIPTSDFLGLLPPELTDLIFAYLSPSTLRQCTLVSKSWHCAITPLLYHSVVLETDDYFLQKFSQTLRNSPHLAPLVRRLAFVLPTGHSATATRVSFFMQRCFESLQNLRVLAFDGPFVGLGDRLVALGNKGIEFPELREVRMGTYVQVPAAVEAVWKLPALETLQMSIGNFNHAEYDFSAWPEATGLKSLSLRSTNLDYQSVSNLLSLAPGIRKLNFADYRNVNEFERLPDCAELHIEKLAYLESLMVGIVKYSSLHPSLEVVEITPDHGFLHPMTNLTRLQKLDISVQSLLGWYPEESPRIADVIPTSLTQLTLNEDRVGGGRAVEEGGKGGDGYKWSEQQLIGRLGELLRETAMGYTNIQTVEFGPLGERWTGEALDELRMAITRNGYSFEEEMLEGHGQYLKIHV